MCGICSVSRQMAHIPAALGPPQVGARGGLSTWGGRGGVRGADLGDCGRVSRLPPGWIPPARRHVRVFTAGDALAAGATPGEVRYRLETGAWVRVAGRGLRLASDTPAPHTDAYAMWATWPDSVLARESALRVLLRSP